MHITSYIPRQVARQVGHRGQRRSRVGHAVSSPSDDIVHADEQWRETAKLRLPLQDINGTHSRKFISESVSNPCKE